MCEPFRGVKLGRERVVNLEARAGFSRALVAPFAQKFALCLSVSMEPAGEGKGAGKEAWDEGPTDAEVDAAIEEEKAMAAEEAVAEEKPKMRLEDWRILDTPEWDPEKFTVKDLRVFLASLPQAPAEHVPEDHSEGQVSWDKGVLKIALGQKVQGPHGVPPEGESEDPPELSAGTLRYAYNCTFPCPTEEAIQQKNLKKPGG